MLDFLYGLGQAATLLLLLYGGFLGAGQWLPARVRTANLTPALEDELLLLKHIHNDA